MDKGVILYSVQSFSFFIGSLNVLAHGLHTTRSFQTELSFATQKIQTVL